MRFIYLQHIPYRHLPQDFAVRFPESVVTTPYLQVAERSLTHADIRAGLDESMHAARAGFDAVGLTEHGQSSYDMDPNPDLGAAALAYQIGAEDLNAGIYVVGRSLGKSREPLRVAEELAWLDHLSAGRLMTGFPVGLPYDANINAGIPPIQTRGALRREPVVCAEGMDGPGAVRVERQVFAVHGGERVAASLPGATSDGEHHRHRESQHDPIRPAARLRIQPHCHWWCPVDGPTHL
jgi:luciferase-like monooxygenase